MKKAIVLAAGEGKRMKSNTPKVLHHVLGISMLENVIRELKKSEIEKIIVIVGHGKEEVIREIKSYGDNVIYKEQPVGEGAPYGTGFAVMAAIDEIAKDDEVLVVCGDTPLLRGETLKEFMNFNKENNFSASVMTANVEENYGYGRIIKNSQGFVEKIVEEKDATDGEKKITEINSGVYTFLGKALLENLNKLDTDNSQGELYLTDVVKILNSQKENVGGFLIKDELEILGVNSRVQLAQCEKILQKRINNKHLEEGVSIINPDSTIIGLDVEIGKDTIIFPNVRLTGRTKIGENCTIEGDTCIVDSKIGNNTCIKSSYIEESIVGNDVAMGPFAHIRPNSNVGDFAHIGNFVELKNTTFGKYSKAGHLAYLGDSEIGEEVNIGCGVITVNYDGKDKHKTTIKDYAFVGSNANLVAPVNIGKNAYVAAGSTITKDVDEEDLAIERCEQKSIAGWVRRKNRVR